MQIRIDCTNETEWLAERQKHIGASDSAKILGTSKYGSNVDLFLEKTNQVKRKFITNDAVELGKRAEPALRELYKAYHPTYKVDYNQYTIIYQSELPHIASTLDGEIEMEDGTKGILEIKTARMSNKSSWDEWTDRIPNQYFCQILHQLISTGYDFVDVFACLEKLNGELVIKEPYRFERKDYEEDINILINEETAFWECVKSNKMPPLKISI